MLQSERQRQQALIHMLDHLGERSAVLGFHQIQGVLYAMACSPEPIALADWFDLIWLDDDAPFENSREARDFYRLLVELSRHINESVRKGRYRPGVDLRGQLSPAALADWCDGFLTGHHYLENIWAVALDDLDDEELYGEVGALLQAAALLADSEPDWDEEPDEQWLASELQFEQWLNVYQCVCERWNGTSRLWCVEDYFERMAPVVRDAPCPCGSGRRFDRCCLH